MPRLKKGDVAMIPAVITESHEKDGVVSYDAKLQDGKEIGFQAGALEPIQPVKYELD